MKRLVILLSGRGSNFRAILEAIERSNLPIQIAAVISNRPHAPGLAFARDRGIPALLIDHTNFPTREAFDQALGDAIERAAPDLVALAGFMRILTADFCRRFSGRLVNIHPSLLPAFKGMATHQQALDAGVRVHGCTVHTVTADLDHGPIIAQAVVPVHAGESAETLSARVLAMEHRLYPMAIAAILSGRLRLINQHWVDQSHGTFDHEFSPCLVDPSLLLPTR
jgi:phosphoribosylglycinamide formyltransferase-1